ncbi:MAG: Nre family DNA repair protein [DPANN group archaeon]|nr:Nre family DNA repair protein [DPANN group archaeon]
MQGMMCVRCKGKGLCGRNNCQILEKTKALKTITAHIKKDFSGVSPPSIFVGRIGYPDVFMGTLAPVDEKYINICDDVKGWFKNNINIDDIVNIRSQMINSRAKVNVKNTNRFKNDMQEIAASNKPIEIEASYKKPLNVTINLYERTAPVGPIGDLEKFTVCQNISISGKIDKIISDTDLKSIYSINELYKKKIDENIITKLFSSGTLGVQKERKLVPTRWAITAVDDILGKKLIEDVKKFEIVDDFYVYSAEYLGNHFEIILIPSIWQFENIEVTYSKSFWNPTNDIVIYADYENYTGRKTYASNVTGAYYSARLAVLEKLSKVKRQASVLVLREIYDDYHTPLGVWIIRETVRDALKGKPLRFQSFEGVKTYLKTRLKTPIDVFVKKSKVLKESKEQKNLFAYLK